MSTSDEQNRELQQALDEAGRWCRPHHPGWATLQSRLAEAGPALPGAAHPPVRPSRNRARRRWRRVLAGAACASAVVLAVGVYLLLPPASQESPGPIAEAPSPPEPPRLEMALADDCQIEPSGDARYEVVEPRRIRLEHGELYVSVGEETVPHDPFIVETPAGEARSTASSFVVETRSVESTEDQPEPREGRPVSPPFGMRALTQVLVLAGVVQLVGSELNLEARSGEVLAAETSPPEKPAPRLSIPGFSMLASPQHVEQVGLTDDQKAKLGDISAAYRESLRGIRVDFREVPAEERQEKIREIQNKSREAAKNAYQQARDLLTPEQIDQLKNIQLRSSGWVFLQSDRYHEQLGITAEQKEKLTSVIADMQQSYAAIQEEMRKTREESFERALEILDPEQIEKLKDLGIGQQFWWQPRSSVPAQQKQ